jgi:hypothetical protein
MRPHLKYLRYVLAHKFYVLRAGLHIRPWYDPRWLWRLLVHDWSKFLPAEWTPYVQMFYGESVDAQAAREVVTIVYAPEPGREHVQAHAIAARAIEIKRDRLADFNAAWLHHIHFNPHHWQHHILHQDDGRTLVLIPHAVLADEMVADWLAAGPKALRLHTMEQAVIETIQWYAKMHAKMQLRQPVRQRVEAILLGLAAQYGLDQHANDVRATAATRVALMADIR